MSWITFTADHVKARLAARELDAYEETSTADGSGGTEAPTPRLDAIVTQVLGQFRGAIRANPRLTEMGPDGTLPESCIGHAAVVARTSLIGMLPHSDGMTDLRRDEYQAANAFLERLPDADAGLIETDSEPVASTGVYGGNKQLDF